MKMSKLECEYEDEVLGTLCASFEFDIEEWLEIREETKFMFWERSTDENHYALERTTTCIHCGQTDVCYPV